MLVQDMRFIDYNEIRIWEDVALSERCNTGNLHWLAEVLQMVIAWYTATSVIPSS